MADTQTYVTKKLSKVDQEQVCEATLKYFNNKNPIIADLEATVDQKIKALEVQMKFLEQDCARELEGTKDYSKPKAQLKKHVDAYQMYVAALNAYKQKMKGLLEEKDAEPEILTQQVFSIKMPSGKVELVACPVEADVIVDQLWGLRFNRDVEVEGCRKTIRLWA